jgi:predicted PurR-regulated permease PerM
MEYPIWLEIVLALSVSVALMGLGGWMLFSFASRAITAAVNLEDRRAKKETNALNRWQDLYEEEKAKRLADVSDLIQQNNDLRKQIERKDALLAKVKVADL